MFRWIIIAALDSLESGSLLHCFIWEWCRYGSTAQWISWLKLLLPLVDYKEACLDNDQLWKALHQQIHPKALFRTSMTGKTSRRWDSACIYCSERNILDFYFSKTQDEPMLKSLCHCYQQQITHVMYICRHVLNICSDVIFRDCKC